MPDAPLQPPGSYTEAGHPFASRGGLKLDKALAESGIDAAGLACADLGSSTGGFTSCLLHRGAAKVYAVDTGYGILDYTLRIDPRVVVMERQNALHTEPPESPQPPEAPQPPEVQGESGDGRVGVDLVVIDLGWTPQKKALAAALRWLSPGGRVITLVKPHYERPRPTPAKRGKGQPKPEPMSDEQARAVTAEVLEAIEADDALGLSVLGQCASPIRGSKGGNPEVLVWLGRRPA